MITSTPRYFRRDIQGLRGIAVIAVFLFHLYPDRFANGYLGVDVFTVISGFVVTSMIFREVRATGKFQVLSFLQRRMRRLVPVLIFVLGLTTLLWLFFVPVDTHRRLMGVAISSVLVGANVFLYSRSTDYFADSDSPMVHLWSLSMEEQFYFGLALIVSVLVALRKRDFKWTYYVTRAWSLGVISVIFLICLALIQFQMTVEQVVSLEKFLFYFPFGRLWQFLAGAVVAAAGVRSNLSVLASLRFRRLCSGIPVLMLLYLILVSQTQEQHFLSWSRISVTFLTTAALLVRCEVLGAEILSRQPLAWIGDRSYSIYLWHLPVIEIWYWMSGNRIGLVSAIAVIVIASESTYRLFEQPFRSNGHSRKFHRFLVVASLFAILGSAIAVSNSAIRNIVADRQTEGRPLPDVRNRWAAFADRIPNSNCVQRAILYECGELNEQTHIVLVGDSHALAISHTFLNVANQLKLTPYVHVAPGCQFLTSPLLDGTQSGNGTECEQRFRDLYQDIINRNLVVVVSECPRGRNSDCPDRQLSTVHPSGLENLRKISEVQNRNIYALVKSGLRIVLIQDLPIVVDEIRRRQSLYGSLFTESSGTSQPIDKRFLEADNYLDNSQRILASRLSGFLRLYDPSAILCSDSFCQGITSEGLPVWSNEDHLTVYGAELLRDSMLKTIREVVRQS
jgi:peptidoglycan/LPS O-acetylase OafA/YrhL